MVANTVNAAVNAATKNAAATFFLDSAVKQRVARQQRVLWRAVAVVVLMFVLMTGLATYFIVRYVNRDIEQDQIEQAGVAYIAPLAELNASFGSHWQFAEKMRSSNSSGSVSVADMAQVDDDMQKAIGAINRLNTQTPAFLNLGDAWQNFLAQWKAVQNEASSGHVADVATYESADHALQKFISTLRDRAHLSLDNNGVETRYLIAASTESVPAILDVLSKPVVIVDGVQATVNYDPLTGVEILSQPSVTAALLEQRADQLSSNLEHAFDEKPALKKVIGSPLDQTLAYLSGIFGAAQNTSNLGTEGEHARRAVVTLARAISDPLDGLLQARIGELRHKRGVEISAALVLLLAILVSLGVVGRAAANAARERELQAAKIQAQDQANQAAVLQLLNEMAEVASGNLKVRAQVTDSVTGALADSINFTIEELRNLVARVNKAAEQVAQSVEQTRTVSSDLAVAAQKQRGGLNAAGGQMKQLTQTIHEVTKSAIESAEVARRSLTVAEKGSLAVGNSIMSMNDIRERIQETAKQIKRLGESSQEIGEIVELIDDITAQTNVLALNASIQAASAGEAGRGFSIVAEEIQRLAERSAEATKQVGALVQRIQSDTQESIVAMEKSTQGVVEGTKLSDAAGTALNEIREVSNQLAGLNHRIAEIAQVQFGLSNRMIEEMPIVLDETEKVALSSQRANEAIEHLVALAGDLRKSASGFQI